MKKEWLESLNENAYFNTLKGIFNPYLAELKRFHFSLKNPLFWMGGLMLLFLLSRLWGFKKALSYCILVAAILLATSSMESFTHSSLVFDYTMLLSISFFIIALISIYYLFIKAD